MFATRTNRTITTLSSADDSVPVVPLLPSDFGLPPLVYLAVLLAAAAVVGGLLYRTRPSVTEAAVTALAPWMAAGGTLYAMYQVEVVPPSLVPFFGSPAVYLTVGVLAGAIWAAAADRPATGWQPTTAPGVLALTGSALLVATLAAAYASAVHGSGGPNGLLSVVILLVSVVLTAVVWVSLKRLREVSATGTVGLLAVFGHALDGVSTTVGYDLLGFGEQTPLSRLIIEFSASLPTADVIGAGWLFIIVKLVLAGAIVALFDEFVREEPTEGYLLLGLIAAVGLGPGAHNVVLFAIT